MKVETYEIEQNNSEASEMAKDSEALELSKQLGLTGQIKLANKETDTRIPYRVMEETEALVFKALCPKECSIEEYSDDCIPLRVLQVAAHAKNCGLFDKLEVWSAKPFTVIEDPILVGRTSKKNSWGGTEHVYYLLARWGKSLMPFEQMEAMAIELLRKARTTQFNEIIERCKAELNMIAGSTDVKRLSSKPNYYTE